MHLELKLRELQKDKNDNYVPSAKLNYMLERNHDNW